MGGGQSLTISLNHPDLFHYVLGYSAAIGGQIVNTEEAFRQVLDHPSTMNSKLRLVCISVGKQDFLYQANRQFADTLTTKGIKLTFRETEGAHVWSVWRNNLFETAPMLFTENR